MPDLVGDYLIIRRLQHEAYLGALRAQVDIVKLLAAKHDTAAFCSVRGKGGLEVAQKRRFAAAGCAAQDEKFTLSDAQAHAVKRLFGLLGVGKA